MAQIEIKDLTFTYATMEKPALERISFDIQEGEFIVICGESGCGKSTLLRNLKPAIRPSGKTLGEVKYNSQNIEEIDDRTQAQSIGYVMQNPDNQIVTDKVWSEMAFGLENMGYKQEVIRARVFEMAEYFGISDWYYQSVDTLSGGQKQILNLASVLVMHPTVLVLDEPTAQLDPIAAENFLEIIKKINDDLGITIIMSEHRLENLLESADKLLLMDNGKVKLFDCPKNVVGQISNDKLMKLMPNQVQLFERCNGKGKPPLCVRDGRKWIKSLKVTGEIGCEQKTFDQSLAIKGKNLWFRYDKKGKDIIRGLDIEVRKGEIFAVLGGNGTGKTTTMSLLSGINKAYRGKLNIDGTISALPQNVQTLFKRETVREEVSDVAKHIIEENQLLEILDRHPYDISGGQQQKVAMTKVLGNNPEILLLDEPTIGLDNIYKDSLGERLQELKKQGKTIVIISHDADFCGQYADRCGLFADGVLVSVDNFREFFSNNRFYTTTINKMAGTSIKRAINKEDVICFFKAENII